MPTKMNCPHSGDGWCLDCVESLRRDKERLDKLQAMLKDQKGEFHGRLVELSSDCGKVGIGCLSPAHNDLRAAIDKAKGGEG